MEASAAGHAEVVQLLIDADAKIDMQDHVSYNNTEMNYAI
jgi:hypothetical protein